jgi:hypothetical protein
MRRNLLTIASHAFSRPRVSRSTHAFGRRYIRISTIPSGALDEFPADGPDISNAMTPGKVDGLYGQITHLLDW